MQRIGRWVAGAVAMGLLAGAGACGGGSTNDDDANDNDSSSATDGTSGGSGGANASSGSGANGTRSGNNSSSSTGNTTVELIPGTPTPFEDYWPEAAAILCRWMVPCCQEWELELNQADCTKNVEAGFVAGAGDPNPDNFDYDPDLAGDCLATAREFYKDVGCQLGDRPPIIAADLDAACSRVFTGKQAPGEFCSGQIECAHEPGDDADCRPLGSSDTDVCIIERRAEEGEPCYWTCTDRGGVSFCSGSSFVSEPPSIQGKCNTNDQLYCAGDVCARQPGLGESCAGNALCHEGYCLNDLCVPGGEAGDPCQVDLECTEGLYCDSTACAPKKTAGELCEDSNECQSESCDYDEGTCSGTSVDDLGIALLCSIGAGAF